MDSSSQRERGACYGGSILGLPMVLLVQILFAAVDVNDFMKSALQLSTVCKAFQEAVQAFTEASIGSRTVTAIHRRVHGEAAQMLQIGKLVRLTPRVESLTVIDSPVVPSMISFWSTVIGTTLRKLTISTEEMIIPTFVLNWKHFQALASLPVLENLKATVTLGPNIAKCRVFESVKRLNVIVKKQKGDEVVEGFLRLFPNLTFLRMGLHDEVEGYKYVVEHAILEELNVIGDLHHLKITCPRLRILTIDGENVGELVFGHNGCLNEIYIHTSIRDVRFEVNSSRNELHNSIFEYTLTENEDVFLKFLSKSMNSLEKVQVIILDLQSWGNVYMALKNTVFFPRLAKLTLFEFARFSKPREIQRLREWLKVSPKLQHMEFISEQGNDNNDEDIMEMIEELRKLFPSVCFRIV